MSINETINQAAGRIEDELVRIRRAIHQNPELGFQEHETATLVGSYLEKLGVPFRTGVGRTGVVGLIEGAKDGPTLAIRADMDALPIQENTGLPFASKNPGKMHACGHDVHTAALLGVASVMNGLRGSFAGRVKLIFQPNEEGLDGAQAMIADGVFENPAIDRCLSYHNWPSLAAGKIGYHQDVSFASSDAFDLTLRGVSGHAAHPHMAVDVITAGAYFITQLQTVVSREVSPVQPAVVSIGKVEGGTARNILPDSLRIEGTVRTQNEAAKAIIAAAFRRLLEGMKIGMRVDYELDYRPGVPVLRNDKGVLARVLASASDILGADNVVELPEASMGSEDFAFFSVRFPSAHLRIGSRIEGLDTALHRSNFTCNELAIPTAVRAVSRAAFDLLQPG